MMVDPPETDNIASDSIRTSLSNSNPVDNSHAIPPTRFLMQWIYLIAGLLCLGLATAGAFLPVLPCTPFVLLAVYCFSRSSKRLHRWLLNSRLFGPIIQDWQQHRAIRRRVRNSSIALVVAVWAITLLLVRPSLGVGILITLLISIGLTVIVRLPVRD